MIRTTVVALLLSAAMAVPALAQNNQQYNGNNQPYGHESNGGQGLSQRDQNILNRVAETDQGEIRLGLLAEKQAESPAVEAFARLTALDHTEAENLLSAVLDQYGMQQVSDGMTQQDQNTFQQLRGDVGHQFDVQYMRNEVQGQERSLQRVERELRDTHNFDVRALLAGMIPIQKQHLELAEAVDQYINNNGNGGSEYMSQNG